MRTNLDGLDPETEALYGSWRSDTLKYVAAVLKAHPEFWVGMPDPDDSLECDPYPKQERSKIRLDGVLKRVARMHNVSADKIIGHGRSEVLNAARREAWMISQELGISLTAIGLYFDRDHTTVMAGISHIKGTKRKPSSAGKVIR